MRRNHLILITHDKSKDPYLVAIKEENKVNALHILGLYDFWICRHA